MIYKEIKIINNKQFDYTYSDTFLIERDGVQYVEAYDPVGSGREYTETDIPLPLEQEEEEIREEYIEQEEN